MGIADMVTTAKGATSYLNMATGLARNPSRLLGFTPLSFLTSSTLSRMERRSDPQLDCFWEVTMPKIPPYKKIEEGIFGNQVAMLEGLAGGGGIVGAIASPIAGIAKAGNDALTQLTGNVAEFVELNTEYVEQIELSFREYSEREVFRAGAYKKFPDTTSSISDITLTFYAGASNESFKYIDNWAHWVMFASTPTVSSGAWSPAALYKKTITVALMDENSNNVYVIDYLGCWPKTRSSVTLGASGERVTYDVSFSVDDINIYGYDLISLTERIGNAVGNAVNAVKSAASNAISGLIK